MNSGPPNKLCTKFLKRSVISLSIRDKKNQGSLDDIAGIKVWLGSMELLNKIVIAFFFSNFFQTNFDKHIMKLKMKCHVHKSLKCMATKICTSLKTTALDLRQFKRWIWIRNYLI